MKLTQLEWYKDQKVAILGYWREWKSSLRFLKKLNFSNITILDKNTFLEQEEKVNYKLGENYLDELWNYDLIFKSPWISPYNEKISPFIDKIITQIQIILENYNWKIIWITWTKGKSTISTLTFKILEAIWYKVKLVGNIWNPVLDEIDILKWEKYDYIVYELSSYMLEWINSRFYMGIINNIFNCHLNWHNWKINYSKAKFNLINNSEIKIINSQLKDSPYLKDFTNIHFFWDEWEYIYKNWMFYISEHPILKDENIALQWEHNRFNITAILWILDQINKEEVNKNIKILENVLKDFSWLSHRLEDLWTYKWIKFIDDANSWTPESTIAAINTYKQNIWTIFLWWQDWDFTYEQLIYTIKENWILNIVLFPETWEKIFWDLSRFNYDEEFILPWDFPAKILKTKSMKNAIKFAYKNTWLWKICLLSCAAASYSLWKSYEEKWELFKKEILEQA